MHFTKSTGLPARLGFFQAMFTIQQLLLLSAFTTPTGLIIGAGYITAEIACIALTV